QAEHPADPGLVDRRDPAGVLVLHHGTRVCDPREQAGRDVLTVLLAGLLLGKSDAGDCRFGVDRAEDRAVADDGLVSAQAQQALGLGVEGMAETSQCRGVSSVLRSRPLLALT